MKIGYYM